METSVLNIDTILSVTKNPDLRKFSSNDITLVLPVLVRACYGGNVNRSLAKKLNRDSYLNEQINDQMKYIRFKPDQAVMERVSRLNFELSKLPISEICEKLRKDSSATRLSQFEQSDEVAEQLIFVVSQILMLKRLLCLEKASLPEGYKFHLFHTESLRVLVINCLFVIHTNHALSGLSSISELAQIILITKSPWIFVKSFLLNLSFLYRNFLVVVIHVSLPPYIEIDRNSFILNLCNLQSTSVEFLSNYIVEYKVNPHLLFDLLIHKCNIESTIEYFEVFMHEMLFSEAKSEVKLWLRPFLKQCWKSKTAHCNMIVSSLKALHEKFRCSEATADVIMRATRLVKLVTGLRLLTQWRLENESDLVDLMTLKLNNVPEELFHSYCKIILTSLVLIPQYILDHAHEKRFLDWCKWILYCHGSSDNLKQAPHIETLLNIGIHFLHNRDSELENLVSSVYGIPINLKTDNFNRIRVFFTQLVLSENETAIICSKLPVTSEMCSKLVSNDFSYLPIDCFCNLMAKNSFEKNHVSVSKWIFAQTVNCKFPLHKSMIELLDNFINSVVNPCSPDEFQEVPFAEKEISTLFIQPFDTAKCEKLFACQTLMVYYLLAYRLAVLNAAKYNATFNVQPNRFGALSNSRQKKLSDLQYSEKLIEMIPIRFIIKKAEKFQTKMSVLYSKLLKLAYNQYPQLFQLNSSVSLKWFFENSDHNGKVASKKLSLTLFDSEQTPLPTAPKLMFVFEKPVKHSQDCIRSLLSMLSMTENDASNMLDAFVSVLPSLLKPNVALRIHNLVLDVWNCFNACLPRLLWMKTVNVLISNSNIPAKYTISDLTCDPLLVLKCDEKVFRYPTLLTIVIRVLSAFLVASRVHLSHQISLSSGDNSLNMGAIKDQEKEDLRAALISTQESTAVQMILEICLPKNESEKFENHSQSENSHDRLNLREIQGIVCSQIHQMFLEDSNIIKLLHFQGYDHQLLAVTTQGIPSMHCCFDFLPELLNQPHREQQIFAIDLVSHLVGLYTIPKAYSIAQLTISVMSTVVEVLPKHEISSYFKYLIPALGRIGKAFPPLCKDVSSVLFRVAEICWSALGAEKSQFSLYEDFSEDNENNKFANEPLFETLTECRNIFATIASDCLVYKLY